MIVCICNHVTDSDIRREVAAGVSDFDTLQARTRCSSTCGCCEDMARDLLEEAVAARDITAAPRPLPIVRVGVAA